MVYISRMTYISRGLLLISITKLPISEECMKSKTTVQVVSGCPQTQEAWTEAAARKNCGGIPHSCPSFVYHCVMNTWQNVTVEVCAPQRIIHGKSCAEYNYLGVRVQRNAKVNCSQCPSVYNSTETFKYPECYRYNRSSAQSTDPEATTNFSLYFLNESTTHGNVLPFNVSFVRRSQIQNVENDLGFVIFLTFFTFVGQIAIIFTTSLFILHKRRTN